MINLYYLIGSLGIFYFFKEILKENELIENNISNFLNQRNLIVIDVRNKDEFNSGHYPNSINIPFDKITQDTVLDLKNK